MEQILTQEEIEALLKAAQDGARPAAAGPTLSGEAVSYDLTSQARPVRGPLPALDMVDDRFARFLRATLTGSLRRKTDTAAENRTFRKFEEVLAGLGTPSCILLFRVLPLRTTALLHLDAPLVYALLDAFFGARGASDDSAQMRELTGIEQRIVIKVATALLEDLVRAWQPIADLKMELTRVELNPQFVTAVPAHAVVVDTRYTIDIDGNRTHLRLTLAYEALEPLRDRLSSGVHSKEQPDASLPSRIWDRVQSVMVPVSADLGRGALTVRGLLSLQPGDILSLDRRADVGAVIRIAGTAKGAGKPIHAGQVYAVRLDRLFVKGEEG